MTFKQNLFWGLLLLWGSCYSSGFADTTASHEEAARHYMKMAQWDFASYEWRTRLEEDPRNVEATVGLATSLLKAGNANEAILVLEKAKALGQEPRILLSLAAIYQQEHQTELAIEIYQNILSQDPFNMSAYKGLHDLTKASPNIRVAEALQKQLAETARQAFQKAQLAIKAGQLAEAAKYYEVVVVHTSNINTVNDWGLTLLLSGQDERAAYLFEQLMNKEISQKKWDLLANYAMISLSVDKARLAEEALRKAMTLVPSETEKAKLYNNLGYIYESQGQVIKAYFSYLRATKLDPGFTKAWLNLAYASQKQKNYPETIRIYHRLLQQDAKNAGLWNKLGVVYDLDNRTKQALQSYQRAIALDPKLKDAYFNLGTAYKKLGKLNKALAEYQKMEDVDFQAMEANQPVSAENTLNKFMKLIDIFFTGKNV